MSNDDLEIRRLLWWHHGCPQSSLYGDDGEMQCLECLLDFRRAAPADIEAALSHTRQRRANADVDALRRERDGLLERRDELLAVIARLGRDSIMTSEADELRGQIATLIAEVGTLRARLREASAALDVESEKS